MAYRENTPGLTVYRPSLNLDDETVAPLLGVIRADSYYNRFNPDKLVVPAEARRVRLVTPREVAWAHQALDLRPSMSTMKELADCIHKSLPETAQTAAYAHVYPRIAPRDNEEFSRTLTVGATPKAVAERQAARAAIRNFFAPKKLPEVVWDKDIFALHIPLLRSSSRRGFQALRKVELGLKADPTLLPAVIVLNTVRLDLLGPDAKQTAV